MSQKKNKYDNSKLFDVHKWSDYPEVNRTVDLIYRQLMQSSGMRVIHEIQKKHVKVIILDLWATWLADTKMYISYSRARNHFKGNSRYNKLHISYRTIAIVDELEKKGYVENKIGFNDRSTGNSRMSRMKAKSKLIKLIEKDCSPEMIQTHPDTECIILRDKNKNDIEYRDTTKIKSMRSDLYEYNNLIRINHFDIPGYPKDGAYSRSEKKKIKINHSDKFVRRIFNNGSFKEGGRYYGGWWQQIPKEWRQEIRINNAPTVEIDYSGLHIVILYALEGIDYWKTIKKDVYEIAGYEKSDRMRNFLKQILLTILNCKNEAEVCKSIRYSISRANKEELKWVKKALNWKTATDQNIKKLLDDFIAPHKDIQKYFHSGFGVKLQYIDSMMAEMVIQGMMEIGIPVLCIHDSFIVRRYYKKQLEYEMNNAFNSILNQVRGGSRKSILPKIKSPEARITWFGDGARSIKELMKNRKIFKQVMIEPAKKDTGYKIRSIRFNKLNLDKKYYGAN
jgi:hypothetical protein